MFRLLRHHSDALRELSSAADMLAQCVLNVSNLLTHLIKQREQDGGVLDRVQALELSHKKWEAEAEALVIQAKGKYDGARNAEERTRTMKKSLARDPESGPESEEELAEAYRELLGIVPQADGDGGEEDGVSSLRPDLELGAPDERSYEAALRAKFG